MSTARPATQCVYCDVDMEPSHMLDGLRYFVCRPCNAWALPFPPKSVTQPATSNDRCVYLRLGVPYGQDVMRERAAEGAAPG